MLEMARVGLRRIYSWMGEKICPVPFEIHEVYCGRASLQSLTLYSSIYCDPSSFVSQLVCHTALAELECFVVECLRLSMFHA